MTNPPRRPIDPLLQQRLEQLSPRKSGQPLPPPKVDTRITTPVTQQRAAGQQRVAGQQAGKQATGKQAGSQTGQRPAQRPTTTVSTTPTSDDRAAALAARVAALNARSGGGNAKGGAKGGARPAAPRPGAKPGPAPSGRRSKPARSSKMAALGLSVVTTAGLAGLFAHNNTSYTVTLTGGTTAGQTGSTTAAPVTTAAGNTPAAPVTTAKGTAAGNIKDGTYTGGASQNRWGAVQVAVVYAGGKISDVQVLQYPDSHQQSVWINQQALPMLIQETVQAQTYKVDTIGGATYTSKSYKASLQSAIDAAKKASGVTG